MGSLGFLSVCLCWFVWVGFLVVVFQAPLAAKFIDDASWLFAVVVAQSVANEIKADDSQRRRPASPDGIT